MTINIHELVAKSWKTTLSVDEVEDESDFFDLGGDSLAALEIAAAIVETIGDSAASVDQDELAMGVLESPTLAEFVEHTETILEENAA